MLDVHVDCVMFLERMASEHSQCSHILSHAVTHAAMSDSMKMSTPDWNHFARMETCGSPSHVHHSNAREVTTPPSCDAASLKREGGQ